MYHKYLKASILQPYCAKCLVGQCNCPLDTILNECWLVPVGRSPVKTWKRHQLIVTFEKLTILYFLQTSVSPQRFAFLIQDVHTQPVRSIYRARALEGSSFLSTCTHGALDFGSTYCCTQNICIYIIFEKCYLIFLIFCLYFLLQRVIYPGWTNKVLFLFYLKCLQTVPSEHTLNAHITQKLNKNKTSKTIKNYFS